MSSDAQSFIESSRTTYPHVSFPHESVHKTLIDLRHGGLDRLHIIADFDMTLTRHWIKSEIAKTGFERNLSSHAVLERGPAVSKGFAEHTAKLAEHYYPFEIDATIGLEEKTKLMVAWWTAAHAAMIEEGITRKQIKAQAESAQMQFRTGLVPFIDSCDASRVPLLIFSAGIADVIEELLAVNGLTRPSQSIVSNHMIFGQTSSTTTTTNGSDPPLTGFREPLIHTLNKGEHALHGGSALTPRVQETLVARKNVVLMGDSIGDARMADGVQHDALLKIGFFNFGGDARKAEFEQTFDVVISGDAGLEWVTDLLAWIAGR